MRASVSADSITVIERAGGLKVFAAFLAGLVLIVAVVAMLPTSRDARYAALKEDAAELNDVYRRINHNPKPIDIAFFGSSHTLNGIDDRSIEQGLAQNGIDLSVANLAVRWPGRDLEYLLAKQLFEKKSPKLVMIELDQHEDPGGHRLMAYVADAPDFLCCKMYLNYEFPAGLLAFLRRQLRDFVSQLWPGPQPPAPPSSDYLWTPLHESWNAEQAAISAQKARVDGVPGTLKDRVFRVTAAFGHDAVAKIADLAHAHGAQVAFLYLPARHYLADNREVEDEAFYRQFGPIFYIPKNFTGDDRNWANWSHVNERGAGELVPCIVGDLVSLSRPGSSTEGADACPGPRSGEPFASQR